MNELIKITNGENGIKLVSARELYVGLGMDMKNCSKWLKRNIEENKFFLNGEDWVIVPMTTTEKGGRPTDDYVINIEMAKHLAMKSDTDNSHKYRNYFIQCEKLALEVTNKDRLLLGLFSDDKMVVAESHKQLVVIEVAEATKPLLKKIEEDKVIVDFGNQISACADSIDVGQFAKLIKDEDIKLGRNKLYEWLRNNKYLQKDNVPYQRAIDMGLFEVEESTYKTPYGEKLNIRSYITGKGQIYLVEKLRKEFK